MADISLEYLRRLLSLLHAIVHLLMCLVPTEKKKKKLNQFLEYVQIRAAIGRK